MGFIRSVTNSSLAKKSEYQPENNSSQAAHRKKQMVSTREGKYYCTYLIDEKGHKILLARVPIAQIEDPKGLEEVLGTDTMKFCSNSTMTNDRAVFEYQQKMRMETAHRENLQEIMDILSRLKR